MRLATAAAWVVLPIVAGTCLYLLKMQVETQEQRLAAIQARISDTRDAIHVLKAEWSYLNDPVRLRAEAERHLGLHPMRPDQIVSIDALPFAAPAPAAPVTMNLSPPENGWSSLGAPAPSWRAHQ
jgi:hypothetical protein